MVVDTERVFNTKATELPQPVYRESAINARADGLVRVEVIVDESGRVVAAKAIYGHPLLFGPAIEAARRA